MATRAQIEAAARRYVGTAFRHQGRTLGHGIDCVGLVLCVAEELGVTATDGKSLLMADYPNYGPDPDTTKVFDHCCARLIRKTPANLKRGDVVCMKVPISPTHVGIITEIPGQGLGMVHAYGERHTERCVEHILDITWRRRIVAAFEFPGTEE